MRTVFISLLALLLLSGCSRNIKPIRPQEAYLQSAAYKALNPYQQDFSYYIKVLVDTHPNPYAELPKPQFDSLVVSTMSSFTEKTTLDDFIFALQSFDARLKDGHTNVHLSRSLQKATYFSVYVKWIDQDWYITGLPEQEPLDLLGSQLLQINHRPAKEVMQQLMNLVCAENDIFKRNRALHNLRNPSTLAKLGLSDSDSLLTLQMKTKTGLVKDVEIAARPSIELNSLAIKGITAYQNKLFHYTILPEENVCYLQFNEFTDRQTYLSMHPYLTNTEVEEVLHNKDLPSWCEFLNEMFQQVRRTEISNIVIDLRYNGGGNSTLGDLFLSHCTLPDSLYSYRSAIRFSELSNLTYSWMRPQMRQLKKHDKDLPFTDEIESVKKVSKQAIVVQAKRMMVDDSTIKTDDLFKGKLYLLIGSNTFSSATDFATICQDNHLATLYGTPTGGKPSCFGDVLSLTLPNTKVECGISFKYFQRPDPSRDPQDSLYPDISCPLSLQDLIDGRDVTWDRVLQDIHPN